MADIQIILDKKARTATAVLATSNWPAIEQEMKPHAVHPHTKQTRQFVASFAAHPAVTFVNEALAAGQSVAELLTTLIYGAQTELLTQFSEESKIEDVFWSGHEAVWQTAVSECEQIFQNCPLPTMLAQMGGKTVPIRVMPTLVYPMLKPAVMALEGETAVLLPPPKAWGESPPWPYKEDPIWVVVEAAKAILSDGLQPALIGYPDSEKQKLVQAGVALCLEKMFDEFERQAYVVRIKKEENIKALPQIAAKLQEWLTGARDEPVIAILEIEE